MWPALIAAAASMAGNAAAADAAASASKEGARRFRDTQNQSMAFQKEILNDQIGLQRPFYDQGLGALSALSRMRSNPNETDGFGAFQQKLALSALLPRLRGRVSSGVLSRMNEDIAARNQWDQRARLYDMVKVGQGSSASAGNSYQDYGNALARAYSGIGNAMAQGRAGAAEAWQNAGTRAVNTAGGVPGYLMTRPQGRSYTDSQGGDYMDYGGARVKSIY